WSNHRPAGSSPAALRLARLPVRPGFLFRSDALAQFGFELLQRQRIAGAEALAQGQPWRLGFPRIEPAHRFPDQAPRFAIAAQGVLHGFPDDQLAGGDLARLTVHADRALGFEFPQQQGIAALPLARCGTIGHLSPPWLRLSDLLD